MQACRPVGRQPAAGLFTWAALGKSSGQVIDRPEAPAPPTHLQELPGCNEEAREGIRSLTKLSGPSASMSCCRKSAFSITAGAGLLLGVDILGNHCLR